MFEWLPEFESPQRLWVLLALPALVLLYIILMRVKGRVSLRYTNTGLLGQVLGSQRRWTRHLAVAMSLASLVSLGLAWAQPLGTEKVPRERATVMMVLDNSMSMQAQDVEPDRLTAAKQAASDFIAQLPDGFNVGLVALNGNPERRMPPSTDRTPLRRALEVMELEEGTAIGEAITLAVDAIDNLAVQQEGEEEPAPAMIVLLSDGTNTVGEEPAAAARAAAEQDIPIFTLAYGTENGYVDIDGARENVAPDVEALQEIAEITDGKAVTADSAADLHDAYEEIGSSVGYEEVSKPITAQYAFVALGFAIIAAMGAIMMAARWPR